MQPIDPFNAPICNIPILSLCQVAGPSVAMFGGLGSARHSPSLLETMTVNSVHQAIIRSLKTYSNSCSFSPRYSENFFFDSTALNLTSSVHDVLWLSAVSALWNQNHPAEKNMGETRKSIFGIMHATKRNTNNIWIQTTGVVEWQIQMLVLLLGHLLLLLEAD